MGAAPADFRSSIVRVTRWILPVWMCIIFAAWWRLTRVERSYSLDAGRVRKLLVGDGPKPRVRLHYAAASAGDDEWPPGGEKGVAAVAAALRLQHPEVEFFVEDAADGECRRGSGVGAAAELLQEACAPGGAGSGGGPRNGPPVGPDTASARRGRSCARGGGGGVRSAAPEEYTLLFYGDSLPGACRPFRAVVTAGRLAAVAGAAAGAPAPAAAELAALAADGAATPAGAGAAALVLGAWFSSASAAAAPGFRMPASLPIDVFLAAESRSAQRAGLRELAESAALRATVRRMGLVSDVDVKILAQRLTGGPEGDLGEALSASAEARRRVMREIDQWDILRLYPVSEKRRVLLVHAERELSAEWRGTDWTLIAAPPGASGGGAAGGGADDAAADGPHNAADDAADAAADGGDNAADAADAADGPDNAAIAAFGAAAADSAAFGGAQFFWPPAAASWPSPASSTPWSDYLLPQFRNFLGLPPVDLSAHANGLAGAPRRVPGAGVVRDGVFFEVPREAGGGTGVAEAEAAKERGAICDWELDVLMRSARRSYTEQLIHALGLLADELRRFPRIAVDRETGDALRSVVEAVESVGRDGAAQGAAPDGAPGGASGDASGAAADVRTLRSALLLLQRTAASDALHASGLLPLKWRAVLLLPLVLPSVAPLLVLLLEQRRSRRKRGAAPAAAAAAAEAPPAAAAAEASPSAAPAAARNCESSTHTSESS